MHTIAQKSWPRLHQKFAENLHPIFDFDLKPRAFVWKKSYFWMMDFFSLLLLFFFLSKLLR